MTDYGPTYWGKASRTLNDVLDRLELIHGRLLGITLAKCIFVSERLGEFLEVVRPESQGVQIPDCTGQM
jgi:hypothetical protein